MKEILMDYAEELNGGEEINWENKYQEKHYFYYDYEYKSILGDYATTGKMNGVVYCLDEDFTIKAIDEFGEEKLIKYLKEN